MTHKQMSAKGGRAGKGSPAKAASAKKAALARWAKNRTKKETGERVWGNELPNDVEMDRRNAASWLAAHTPILMGGGGAEQGANNGTCEAQSGARSHTDPS